MIFYLRRCGGSRVSGVLDALGLLGVAVHTARLQVADQFLPSLRSRRVTPQTPQGHCLDVLARVMRATTLDVILTQQTHRSQRKIGPKMEEQSERYSTKISHQDTNRTEVGE